MRATRLLFATLPLALLLACAGEPAAPQDAAGGATSTTQGEAADSTPAGERPLAGETLEFVVPYDAGGGYDIFARLVAPHLEDCTGGPVVVLNEPGAGGLAATTQTAVADPEGPRFQIVNTVGAVSAQIAGVEGARFDLTELSWLARVSAVPNVLMVAPDGPYATFDDFLNASEPVRFVSSGVGANDHVTAAILLEIYDLDGEIITGFAGAPEARQAVLAGDADAQIVPADTSAQLVESGDVRAVLVVGETDDPALDGVPRASEVETATEEGRVVLDALLDLVETGRSVAAPPGVPEARLQALRAAFECALTSDGLLADAQAQDRPIVYLPGEDMAELVTSVLDAPPAFQELLRQAS